MEFRGLAWGEDWSWLLGGSLKGLERGPAPQGVFLEEAQPSTVATHHRQIACQGQGHISSCCLHALTPTSEGLLESASQPPLRGSVADAAGCPGAEGWMKPQLSPRGHTTQEAGLNFFSLRLCKPWIYTPAPGFVKSAPVCHLNRHRLHQDR